ncbi:MAG: hypothetical protein Q8P11_04130 [bacterium]|nr:hypothetical protein [bacterium]
MRTIFASFFIFITMFSGGPAFASHAPVSAGHIAEAPKIDDLFIKAQSEGVKIGEKNNLVSVVGLVIKAILGLMGIVFLILMIYAGILWMTAAGEKERVEKARDMISTAIIGLLITIGSYTLTYFVVENLQNAVGIK